MLLLSKPCARCGGTVIKKPKYSITQWRELIRHCDDCIPIVKLEKVKKMAQVQWGNHVKNHNRKTPKELKLMYPKFKIAFVWQGISDKSIYDSWQDGLRYAIDKLSKKHTVHLFEPWQDIEGYDVILYWEAPVTAQGQNAPHYNKVRSNPTKKILLFAGGQIKNEWVNGFDMLFLESKINEKECDDLGIRWHHAFGINNKKFKVQHVSNFGDRSKKKKYDGMLHGTCASWKRQWLIGEAFGERGCLIGKTQDSDPYPFNRCRELGCDIFPASGPGVIKQLMNNSYALVNCCDYWGGGQRATLEAMAAGLPVVCCSDSPKNREYVEESGFGMVCEPDANSIRNAVQYIKDNPNLFDWRTGVEYVKKGWSGDVYAEQIYQGIKKLLC